MCKKNIAIEELWPYKVRIILAKWVSSQYLHALQFDNACRMGACSIPQWVCSCPTPAIEQSCHTIDISCACQPSDCILCIRCIAVFISQSHKYSWWSQLSIDWNKCCTMGDFAWHPGRPFSFKADVVHWFFMQAEYCRARQPTFYGRTQALLQSFLKVVLLSCDLGVSVWVHVN